MSNPLGVAFQIADILESLGVPYFITGSLASSVLGEPRLTRDFDLVADLREEHLERFAAALTGKYDFTIGAARDAIRNRSSFNVIDRTETFKVDIFILKQDAFHLQEMARKKPVKLSEKPDRFVPLVTPEDLVIAKLLWFRKGHEVSNSQWRDILGILKVQGERLDLDYLRKTAWSLDLASLLDKALEESGF